MIKHTVYTRHNGVAINDRLSIPLIKHCIRSALHYEGVDVTCEVSVLITDDRGIRKINKEFRGIDAPTVVLSFPMQEFIPAGWTAPAPGSLHPETGLLPLGDIILSAKRVEEQARKNSQSRERETAYLVIHSVLHLLGYDHIDEAEDKKQMRERENKILFKILNEE